MTAKELIDEVLKSPLPGYADAKKLARMLKLAIEGLTRIGNQRGFGDVFDMASHADVLLGELNRIAQESEINVAREK